ncbi:MAG: hypothetical protein NC339_02505 [Muribaculaceae bacterium]|nr:hypothetical protein [Muribaculaceae bacterium]
MIFALSNTVITDTVRSLAAFHTLTCQPDERRALSPVLDSQRRGILVNMVRQAFAETVLKLLPYSTGFTLDNETPTSPGQGSTPASGPVADDIMKVELNLPSGLPPDGAWSVRRALEQTVAMTALSRLVTAIAEDAGLAMASRFEAQAKEALKAVTAALTTADADFHPFVRF